jgi:hypothetical protein
MRGDLIRVPSVRSLRRSRSHWWSQVPYTSRAPIKITLPQLKPTLIRVLRKPFLR